MTKQKDIGMPFGKYKGTLIADIPNNYLFWIMEQDWFVKEFPTIKEQVVIEIKYRQKFNIVLE